LNEVVDHVKTELMPDFDYEEFDRRQAEWEAQNRLEEDDYEDGESVDMEESGDNSFDEELDDRPANKSKGDDEDVSW
jgi:hypothetical protein